MLHPVNLRMRRLDKLEEMLFRWYRNMTPRIFRRWIAESTVILIESGFPIIFIRLCQKINPDAAILYIASDGLKTINCANFILREFTTLAPTLNRLCLMSRLLSEEMPEGSSLCFIPHGIDKSITNHINPSPYEGGINAVSVGSMLFDASFFNMAASAFPGITFHVIGGGASAAMLSGPNIKVYGEVPFLKTIPYIKHAHIGIAPYNGQDVAPFLADTSMKLMQYEFFGVPAVCPQVVTGARPGRFGYRPGDAQSIHDAIGNALECGRFPATRFLSWSEVTDRILDLETFL